MLLHEGRPGPLSKDVRTHSAQLMVEGVYRPVGEVTEQVSGRRASPASIHRMINQGGRGGKLHAQLILGKWCCRREDFLDYIARQSAAALEARGVATDGGSPSEPPQLDCELAQAGLL